MKPLMSWRVIVACLIVGACCLPVGLAMMNGWNPYDLAPVLQQAQAGLSFIAGMVSLGWAALGIMQHVFVGRRT